MNAIRAKARKDMADVYRKIDNHAMRRLLWKREKEAVKIMIDMLLHGTGFSYVSLNDIYKENKNG